MSVSQVTLENKVPLFTAIIAQPESFSVIYFESFDDLIDVVGVLNGGCGPGPQLLPIKQSPEAMIPECLVTYI